MSFPIISERLQTLQESNAQLKGLIERLATINFQPGSVPLSSDDGEGNALQELAQEISQTIREQDEDFEIMREEVEELDVGKKGSERDVQKAELRGAVVRAVRELEACQVAFRKAQVIAKRNLEAAQRAERELLLQSFFEPRNSAASSPVPGQRRRNQQTIELSKEEKTVNASSDVTIALRRTHEMMAQELSRSQFAHETLKESTTALKELGETYSSMDTLLSNSKNLLGTLLRSQKSDTWYLETAFYILLVTIGWLVWRRLLYGPTWWLVWFPMKIFIRSSLGLLGAAGVIGGGSAGTSVSVSTELSTMMQATAVHSSGTRGPSPTAPSQGQNIRVGGGGRGAPMERADGSSGNSMTEQVGSIIDESQNQDAVPERKPDEAGEAHETEAPPQEQPEGQRNPMKRMWEEEEEAPKQAEQDSHEAEAQPQEHAEGQRNPMKRMWEEDKEAPKQAEQDAQKSHDEL
ncbi:uncharacterized protein L3040_009287 [Drepanopeziza brunnea f. sp. 'multigermtubi']|uniref:Sec20 domain containing protein n=1 Tax=Marssonina brunnea f. sp. multigermtubi (strain MB_m1) TaxID=1072389 RepID=K1XEI1_MARBU|nr:Sec20 domain containing protein [Drepanopeziza brunnea f. sp. 'multigermtubi' MB_m1]EKD19273.1 Sec20 domain containing protein [Drepanopeziza brunnea f. sp. 'multigermtubi' MB_m1]KAJ5032692.1 hypothetical protein L3040_009287 [Drepanopeziza brunnea f. sp. 'multigermtubi']